MCSARRAGGEKDCFLGRRTSTADQRTRRGDRSDFLEASHGPVPYITLRYRLVRRVTVTSTRLIPPVCGWGQHLGVGGSDAISMAAD